MQGTTPDDAELFEALGGVKDEGGVWTVSGNVHTYTVAATSPCTENATATVTVIEQAKPNAGLDAELTVCEGTTITDDMLYAALSGTQMQAERGHNQETFTLIQYQLRVHVQKQLQPQ